MNPYLALTVSLGISMMSPQAQAQRNARDAAPFDLTGYWVSIVTEDWRWRMLTAPVGDYTSVPMTTMAREIADRWDREADIRDGNACRPYGAGGIMRVPGRVRIEWQDADTLRIDIDAGTQTRLFHFGEPTSVAERSWQGSSRAQWEMTGGVRGQPPTGGSLRVVTTGLKPGYLRWNGVPYGEQAVVTEYYDRHAAFGQEWFTVTTVVDDPLHLSEPFITSSDFRREPNGARWSPTPCATDPPVGSYEPGAD